MREALDEAFAHDELVIVEAMAPGVEVECGVLGRAALRAIAPAGGARWPPCPGRSSFPATGTTSARSTRPGAWS